MIPWLDPRAGRDAFPDPRQALPRPNGLLAAGGDLHPDRLLAAYRRRRLGGSRQGPQARTGRFRIV